ncbi:MAG: hypothetical protein IJV39_02150 [Ruminococcus sp.]|nr:hypothetical protein [Ruminococcus sp.]
MNKTEFIKKLSSATGLTENQSEIVNGIFESNFFLSKKNSNKIIDEISHKIKIDKSKATEVYNSAYDLIGNSIVDKLKHPFGS